MLKTSHVSARIYAEDKWKTEEIFRHLGITPTQAITMFYKQVQLKRGLPFPLDVPVEIPVDPPAALRRVRHRPPGKRHADVLKLYRELEDE